jgi:hypothetical protein
MSDRGSSIPKPNTNLLAGGLELDWDDWQECLFKEFRTGPGRPVFLYADDDLLVQIGGEGGAENLAKVVRAELVNFGDPYLNVLRRAAKAKREQPDQAPPTLPLLALSVLAATRMERTAGVAPNAYYPRFLEVAGVSEASLLGLSLKQHFDTVAMLWRQFDNWIKTPGAQQFGVSTIRPINNHLTRIGYPLSQALLRRTDRNTLTLLWSALGQDISAELPGEELVRHLRRWMRTSRGLSKQFVDTVAGLNEKSIPEFGKALQEAARNWDGVILSRSGREMREAVLAVQPTLANTWKAVWIVDAAGGAVSVPLKSADLLEMPNVYSADGQDWTGISDGLAVLAWDSLRGCWASTGRMLPGANHALVWHPSLSESVKNFVGRSSNSGSLTPRKLTSDGVGFVENVSFWTDKEIADSLAAEGLTGIRVAGTTSPRLSLRDGLKITNALNDAIYIHGGEPDLAIPPGDEAFLPVQLDGGQLRNLPRGVLSPLRSLAEEFAPGVHALVSDDGSVKFETISPGEVVVEPGPRGASCALPEMSLSSPIAVPDRFGTRLVIIKRNRDKTWLLGRGGHLREMADPPLPHYWDLLLAGQASPLHYMVIRKECEGWLVQRKFNEFFVDQLVDKISDLVIDDSMSNPDLWFDVLGAAADSCVRPDWLELLAEAGVR